MRGQWEVILSTHWLLMGMADRSPPLLAKRPLVHRVTGRGGWKPPLRRPAGRVTHFNVSNNRINLWCQNGVILGLLTASVTAPFPNENVWW
jgi:hypothetical protein